VNSNKFSLEIVICKHQIISHMHFINQNKKTLITIFKLSKQDQLHFQLTNREELLFRVVLALPYASKAGSN
jgi:hypothetical protein